MTFANDESAASAIGEMNGAELDGRTIKVNEAEDKGFRSGGGGGRVAVAATREAAPPVAAVAAAANRD